MRHEELFIAAALSGLCQHSAAKGHYDVDELGARAVAIGRAAAKAHEEASEGATVLQEPEPAKPAKPAKR